jgi:hypothetical protein
MVLWWISAHRSGAPLVGTKASIGRRASISGISPPATKALVPPQRTIPRTVRSVISDDSAA